MEKVLYIEAAKPPVPFREMTETVNHILPRGFGMRRTLQGRITEFRNFWKHYVLQSLLGGVALAVIMLSFTGQNIVVAASIGSSIFIVFAMPGSVTAQSRNIVGGHVMGMITGSVCHFIPHESNAVMILVYALAVGLSIFLMSVSDTEHPPASGTALGLAMGGFSWPVCTGLFISTIILALIHRFCARYIKDLI